jgi:hypothetical protein
MASGRLAGRMSKPPDTPLGHRFPEGSRRPGPILVRACRSALFSNDIQRL